MTPKVTIIIPTKNRAVVLMKTLEKCRLLKDPSPEIIVYDDNSDTDYGAEIKQHFPEVIFKKSDHSVGPCELRNRMMALASGDLIIGLDDDSYFLDISGYHKAIGRLLKTPQSALIGFKVRLKDGIQFPSTQSGDFVEACEFLGCGFVAYKEALQSIGGFDPSIFRAGEERDLAIRLVDRGYGVWVDPQIEVFHEYTPVARNHQLIHGYAFRNELLFYLKLFPGWRCPAYIFKGLLSHVWFCLKKGWFGAYANGIAGFLSSFRNGIRGRRPVKMTTVKKYLLLKGF